MKLIISSAIIIGLSCTMGLGQSSPGASDQGGEILSVSVKNVSGSVEVRGGPDETWRAVKVEDVYQEGAEIRTGFKAKVDLAFADNSEITIERVSYFKIQKFRRSGNKVITRSYLSYGKVRAGVEKGPAFSDYKICNTLGTLGVNGTRYIELYVDPGGGIANVRLTEEGNIGWNTGSGSDVNVDPGGSTDHEGTPQDESKNRNNTIRLCDRFGSTKIEKQVGTKPRSQGQHLILETASSRAERFGPRVRTQTSNSVGNP